MKYGNGWKCQLSIQKILFVNYNTDFLEKHSGFRSYTHENRNVFLYFLKAVLNDNDLMREMNRKKYKTLCRFREKPYLCKPIVIR